MPAGLETGYAAGSLLDRTGGEPARRTGMQFGFNLPNSGALAAPETMRRIAQAGEALGFDYLTVTDHIALPDMAEPGYP